MRSRLAWLQLALACVFAAVCARTDPDEECQLSSGASGPWLSSVICSV